MRKFAFDTSFDDPDQRKPTEVAALEVPDPMLETEPELPPAPTFSEEELQAARAVAWSDGMTAGREEAEAGLLARQNRLLEGVAARIEQLLTMAASLRSELEQDTVRIGVAVLKTLYPHSFREEARLEIISAVRTVLQTQDNVTAPLHLTIAAADRAWLAPVIEALGSQRFRLRVEEAMTAGDFRLEWADGGIERQQAAIWERIAALLPENTKNNNTESDQ